MNTTAEISEARALEQAGLPFPTIHAALTQAISLHRQNQLDEAELIYRVVLGIDDQQADALHYLGLIAYQSGHLDDAAALIERALQLKPQNPVYHYNVGNVHYRRRDYDRAISSLRHAIKLRRDYVNAQMTLSEIYGIIGEDGAAVECCKRVAADHWHDAAVLHRVGLRLFDAGYLRDATPHVLRALQLNPRFVDAHNTLGVIDADLGHFDDAEANFRKAIGIEPRNCRAYFNLKTMVRFQPDSPDIKEMETLHEAIDTLPADDAIMLEFSLGKAYADMHQDAAAMRHYLNGNRLKRATISYSTETHSAFFDQMAQVFDRDKMVRNAGAGTDSRVPIFVLGMSRSGTTLVEQLIASHPDVYGAGEIKLLHRAIKRQAGPDTEDRDLPKRLAEFDNPTLRALGADYFKRLTALTSKPAHVTDKLPGNVVLIGLIHLLFPEAPMILVRRHPADVCLSCFEKLFSVGHHFTYDLAELADFYLTYQRLMDHWHDTLPPGRMLEVRYEDVVADVGVEARRMIDYCGLEWDDAVLNFHANRREVRTASLYQVRQPIYRGAAGRWRRYEGELKPLLDILSPVIRRYEERADDNRLSRQAPCLKSETD